MFVSLYSDSRADSSCTIVMDNGGKSIRTEIAPFVDEIRAMSRSYCKHVLSHEFRNIPRRQMSREEEWQYRRMREYNIIRSHVRPSCCHKQVAIFVKNEDGSKILVALVDYFKRAKKLYGGTLSPVLWWDVSPNYKLSLRGLVDFSLSEENLHEALGFKKGDRVHIYAQSLSEIHMPRDARGRLEQARYERMPRKRYTPQYFI